MTHLKNVETLDKISAFNLDRHAVIEASAGTGKTYTLIELVMRLIVEHRVSLDRILLVTFTDQAAGELKHRIRQRLQQALEQFKTDELLQEHLLSCYDTINQASIFTIHGFCHGALTEFAFEQSALFESQLVNDVDIRELVFRTLKRDWSSQPELVQHLKILIDDKSFNYIEELLLELARTVDSEQHKLYPSGNGEELEILHQHLSSIDFKSLHQIESELPSLQGVTDNWKNKIWNGNFKPFLHALSALVNPFEVDEICLLILQTFKDKTDAKTVCFANYPKVYNENKDGNFSQDNRQAAPLLFNLLDQINIILAAARDFQASRKFKVIAQLLDQLNSKTHQYKSSRGLLSYDDMINSLWGRLKAERELPESDQLLTRALRKKYHVALIDEFQDTDNRQWSIFQHLFLQSEQQQHRLWVIGDPKQAIYGFRGADVHTYIKATNHMVENHQGQAYRLTTNYRSESGLINSLNQLFSIDRQGGWFDADEVQVQAASAGDNTDFEGPVLLSNPKELRPINCLAVDAGLKADDLKSTVAEQIALNIKFNLLGQIKLRLKGESRVLEASDICVLVRGKSDAQFVEKALQSHDIPFSYYKKQQLYQSDEAIHYQVILTALANPSEQKRVNNALLTLFFNLKAEQLVDFSEEKLPDINDLWLKLKEAAMLKDWIMVFDLLLVESGALFRARDNSRRTANLLQIKQELLQTALQKNLEINGLLKQLVYWRENKTGEESIHHKDTEQQAVKIMTMHISKGLEFPVVFMMGDFFQNNAQVKYHKYFDERHQCMLVDLTKSHKDEQAAYDLKEAQQLYYVAMTRAVFMLFLPVYNSLPDKAKEQGMYVQNVMPRLHQLGFNKLIPPMPTDTNKRGQCQSDLQQQPTIEPMTFSLDLNGRSRRLHSFSSLSRLKSHQQQSLIESDFNQSLTTELMNSDALDVGLLAIQNASEIPGGVKTGHVLHGIFENVDFAQVGKITDHLLMYENKEIMQVIEKQMQLFRLENKPLYSIEHPNLVVSEYKYQFADWVWHTLNKPIDALNGKKLASILPEQRSHELSFFWSEGDTNLTGFIDLFFRIKNDQHDDYYILDWKSNYSSKGYTPAVILDEVMHKHQYQWQYQLYAMAMQQWFDSLGLSHAQLKGALYVFSRGVNCQENTQNGLFYDDFSSSPWQVKDIKNELLEIDRGWGVS